ncbi:Crp/Fnr family transcriptional regulator [Glycomyces buryatensis]|uniref:Crp/Fnr family transcriptional regulator n=1 Tax=Glycomyces buryatensis TaxID=2570927 RepID=A0A4S8QDN9_9ACTN|nr:Crp/Fnr family transcriptional regulator [Glycomyces buryatensis]THV38624.1 Crp/Fnr family transcriptional regulator [Glycomyces buryatensis]
MENPTQETGLLNEAELGELAELGHRVRYPARSKVVQEGDNSDFVLYLMDGHIQVVTGKPPEIIRIYGPGDIAGERASVTGKLRSADLVAFDEVEAYFIPGREWRRFIEQRPAVLMKLYRATLDRLESREPSRSASASTVEFKVASALIRLLESGLGQAVPEGHRISGISQRELGYLSDISRESVSIGLRPLRERGAISTGRNCFTILDLAEIERVAHRSYRTSEPL